MPKYVPKDMEWFLAEIIQVFTFANGDEPLTWVNTHLIKAATPEEAYTKAITLGDSCSHTFTNTDQVEVTSTFRGLRNLLLIYENLKDGAEILLSEYDDATEEQIEAMITPKEKLGAFALHGEESKITRVSKLAEDEAVLESAEFLNAAAQAKRDQRDYEGAAVLYEQSLRTLRKVSRPHELAYTLRHAADMHAKLGHLDKAERKIKEAISIYRDTAYTNALDLANSLRISAMTYERRAREAWQEAKKLYGDLNIQPGIDEAQHHLATGDWQ